MFKGGSTNCPINKYTIVKSNVTNEEYHIADDIWDHLTFDGSQLQPSMKLSNIIKKEQHNTFWIKAQTDGKVAAYKKVDVKFEKF